MQHSSQHSHSAPKRSRASIIALVAVLVVCLIGAAAGIGYLVTTHFATQYEIDKFEATVEPSTPDDLESDSSQLAKNPIDFETLQAQNPDLYGWISVPGTKVNRGVLQHPTDNSYYLTHDENGEYLASGAPFTELYNSKTFQDPVTVIYGHNWKDDLVFASLHWFQDESFFKENKYFYIYTPGHIYTYEIVSAFTHSDQHLLATKDYSDAKELAKFEEFIQNPNSISVHTRKVSMDENSKIVVLSTCNTGALAQYGRYLVCGVMVDDVATQ